jgi:hypothetical protein
MEEHNTLTRRYKCSSSLLLLARIANDYRITRHIKKDRGPWEPLFENVTKPLSDHRMDSPSFRALLENLPLLKDIHADASNTLHIWTKEAGVSEIKYVTTFLLTLLPNATHLSLPKW